MMRPRLEAALEDQISAGAPGALARIEAPYAGLVWAGSAGSLAYGVGRSLGPDDAFRVASVTKTGSVMCAGDRPAYGTHFAGCPSSSSATRASRPTHRTSPPRDALQALGVEAERIYVDHGLTGTHRDRPFRTCSGCVRDRRLARSGRASGGSVVSGVVVVRAEVTAAGG
jgi:hypothetical protein